VSIAGRHDKLREVGARDLGDWVRAEDLLTADVFGAYRYLPPAVGVLPFLLRSETSKGMSLASWLLGVGVATEALDEAHVVFWPDLAGKEPDVLVLLGAAGAPPMLAVLVEAKLHSPQHEIADLSQVGFYAKQFAAGRLSSVERLPDNRAVVFLTRHHVAPADELQRAERELGPGAVPIFWLNWQCALLTASEALKRDGLERGVRLHLEDLMADLRWRGMFLPQDLRSFPMPPLTPLAPVGSNAWLRTWGRP